MVSAWIYGGPAVAQKAIVEASEILAFAMKEWETGTMSLEDVIDSLEDVQNKLEGKRRVFGRYPEYSNRLFTTPIRDLRHSIGAATKLLITGVISLGIELISLAMMKYKYSKIYQSLVSGLSIGLAAYSLYISLQNKIFLPANFGLINAVGYGATIVSLFASGWQIGELLKS